MPSADPSSIPSSDPSSAPSVEPSVEPSSAPSVSPSVEPSVMPSASPSSDPSSVPSVSPSVFPSLLPSFFPSSEPSEQPSLEPSALPSRIPIISRTDVHIRNGEFSDNVFVGFDYLEIKTQLDEFEENETRIAVLQFQVLNADNYKCLKLQFAEEVFQDVELQLLQLPISLSTNSSELTWDNLYPVVTSSSTIEVGESVHVPVGTAWTEEAWFSLEDVDTSIIVDNRLVFALEMVQGNTLIEIFSTNREGREPFLSSVPCHPL